MKTNLILLFSIFLSVSTIAQEFDELMQQGKELLQNYKLDEAKLIFTQAIELDSTSADAFMFRGECSQYKSKKNAEQDWLKSISLDSNNEAGYHHLYRYYKSTSEMEKAKYYLEKAISFRPNDSNNLLLVAQQFRSEGNLRQALEYCNKSISAYKNEGEFLSHVERAEIKYELEDYQGAIIDFETCFFKLTYGMYTASQFEMCGDAHYKLGQTVKACEKWNFAVSHMDIMEPSETAKVKIQKHCN